MNRKGFLTTYAACDVCTRMLMYFHEVVNGKEKGDNMPVPLICTPIYSCVTGTFTEVPVSFTLQVKYTGGIG